MEREHEWAQKMWNGKIRKRLTHRSPQPKLSRDQLRLYTEQMIEEREQEAYKLLPLREDPKRADKNTVQKIQAAF